ncbi:SNF2 family N-terminal domain-containing protein [Blyttiomyces helicus]|uniref:SNF2 family N-terminal domain-containing protein n=1 Tax=Blyttiomyces helicus TaxID=388810 RepID=A0A4P9WEX4_9FUNG|nr:SNF2 family N-terminal domain-containing protein [Blyttiomyces helicus]|eukprot:RKO90952.1 SNF2 family N-terminal domain-containing protein [Blyttiomyces helicus]
MSATMSSEPEQTSDPVASSPTVTPAASAAPVDQDPDLNALNDADLGLFAIRDHTDVEREVIARVLPVHPSSRSRSPRDTVGDNPPPSPPHRALKRKLNALEEKLKKPRLTSREQESLVKQLSVVERQIQARQADAAALVDRVRDREEEEAALARERAASSSSRARRRGESHRDFLIRTGQITPFSDVTGVERSVHRAQRGDDADADIDDALYTAKGKAQPGDESERENGESEGGADEDSAVDDEYRDEDGEPRPSRKKKRKSKDRSDDDYSTSEEDDEDDDDDDDANSVAVSDTEAAIREERGRKIGRYKDTHMDDGDEVFYQMRVLKWLGAAFDRDAVDDDGLDADAEAEAHAPSPLGNDAEFDGGYRLPGDIYDNLFNYQRTCAKWLWELHCQETGGIIGDEMGLGKTVQIVSFLAGLGFSNLLTGPILIVCPATVLRQWVQEFHKWWPPFRVAILHSSGSGLTASAPGGDKVLGDDEDDEFVEEEDASDSDEMYEDRRGDAGARGGRGGRRPPPAKKGKDMKGGKPAPLSAKAAETHRKAKKLLERVVEKGHVLVTTFGALRVHRSKFLPIKWAYAVLDEGHKIRNPDSDVTLTCKQLKVGFVYL